jgi:ankyrin repeat protein
MITMITERDANVAKAIRSRDVSRLNELFQADPALAHRRYGSISWLHIAAQECTPEVALALIAHGCDVNAEQEVSSRSTPLFGALIANNLEMVRLLLEHGADPNRGRLVITAITGTKESLQFVKLLESYGANLNCVYENELTGTTMNALSTAVDWGKADVAAYLRSRGCIPPSGRR